MSPPDPPPQGTGTPRESESSVEGPQEEQGAQGRVSAPGRWLTGPHRKAVARTHPLGPQEGPWANRPGLTSQEGLTAAWQRSYRSSSTITAHIRPNKWWTTTRGPQGTSPGDGD